MIRNIRWKLGRPMHVGARTLVRGLAVVLVGALASCEGQTQTPQAPVLEIVVAPLSLPGIGYACYDIEVANDLGEVVWSQGTPVAEHAAPAICSDRFGNGPGGDIAYVGPCDATDADPDDAGVALNVVTLRLDGLIDATTGLDIGQYQNPCPWPDGCALAVECIENADVQVEFNLTIMRDANQGFFDIAVNFDDIFCSAKVDCAYPATASDPGGPIRLVHDPESGERVQSVVFALACTDGGETADTTHLYMSAVALVCELPGRPPIELTVDPRLGPGNLATLLEGEVFEDYDGDGLADPLPGAGLLKQAMVFRGQESLANAATGQDADKEYWSVALGLDEATLRGLPPGAVCYLRARASASDGTLDEEPLGQPHTPPGHVYPYVDVNVPVYTRSEDAFCTQHPLNGGNGVSTVYTSLDGAAGDDAQAMLTFLSDTRPTPGVKPDGGSAKSACEPENYLDGCMCNVNAGLRQVPLDRVRAGNGEGNWRYPEFEDAGVSNGNQKDMYIAALSSNAPAKADTKLLILTSAGQDAPLSGGVWNRMTGQRANYKNEFGWSTQRVDYWLHGGMYNRGGAIAERIWESGHSAHAELAGQIHVAAVFDNASRYESGQDEKARIVNGFMNYVKHHIPPTGKMIYLAGSSRGGCLLYQVAKKLKQSSEYQDTPIVLHMVDPVCRMASDEMVGSGVRYNPLPGYTDQWTYAIDIAADFSEQARKTLRIVNLMTGDSVILPHARAFGILTPPGVPDDAESYEEGDWYYERFFASGHEFMGRTCSEAHAIDDVLRDRYAAAMDTFYCPGSSSYDPSTGDCCPTGTYYSFVLESCQATPDCGSNGYIQPDSDPQYCVVCEGQYQLDATGTACERVCPPCTDLAGYTLNCLGEGTEFCTTEPNCVARICDTDMSCTPWLGSAVGSCQCDAGLVFDSELGGCVADPCEESLYDWDGYLCRDRCGSLPPIYGQFDCSTETCEPRDGSALPTYYPRIDTCVPDLTARVVFPFTAYNARDLVCARSFVGACALELGGTGEPTFVDGHDGDHYSALHLDGAQWYEPSADIVTPMKPSPRLTLSMWVKPDVTGVSQGLYTSSFSETQAQGVMLVLNADNTLDLRYADCGSLGDTTSRRSKTSAGTLTTGAWNHVVAVIRGPTDMTIWVDGVDAGGSYSGSGGPLCQPGTPRVGMLDTHPTNPPLTFTGAIDELRIFGYALTQSRVLQLKDGSTLGDDDGGGGELGGPSQ